MRVPMAGVSLRPNGAVAIALMVMTASAGLMLAEKLSPRGLRLSRAAGIALIAWGSVLLATV